HQALRTETDGKRRKTCNRQKGPKIKTKLRAYFVPNDQNEKNLDHASNHETQGFRPLLHARKTSHRRGREKHVQPSQSGVEQLENNISKNDDGQNVERGNRNGTIERAKDVT